MLRLLRLLVVAMTTTGQSEQSSSRSVIALVNIAKTRASTSTSNVTYLTLLLLLLLQPVSTTTLFIKGCYQSNIFINQSIDQSQCLSSRTTATSRGPIPWWPQTMMATRYIVIVTAMKTWKINGILLRNRQINDFVGKFHQVMSLVVMVCGRRGCGRHGHCLWTSWLNPLQG